MIILKSFKTYQKLNMNIIKQIELIERVDQLVRLQATGTPSELAFKLNISKTKLYRIIEVMKMLNAPIEYNKAKGCYMYYELVGCYFGFRMRNLIVNQIQQISMENSEINFELKIA